MGLGWGHTGNEGNHLRGSRDGETEGETVISTSIVVSTEGIGELVYAGLGLTSLSNFSRPRA